MPRTQGRYQQDSGFTDGDLMAAPDEIMVSGTASVTRNAASDWSLNQGATLTVNYGLNIGKLLQKTGYVDDLQEQYGGTYGPAGVSGRPPFTGASQLSALSAFRPKGIKVTGFKIVELITGAALTAHTCRVDKNTFATSAAAPTQVAILATGANGLPTATSANQQITTVTLSSPVYITADLSENFFEMTVTTQGGGAYRLVRIEILFEHNWN